MSLPIAVLRRCFLFQNITESQLAQLEPAAAIRRFARGEPIVLQDRPGPGLCLVLDGVVKVSMQERARHTTLAYLAPGDAFGEISLFSGEMTTAQVEAVNDATIAIIDGEAIRSLLADSPDFSFGIIQTLCQRIREADRTINYLTFKNLEGRVAAKLLQLAEKFGEETPTGIRITLALTHAELAELVGTSRETVTKILSLFKKSGLLAAEEGALVIIDAAGLRSWAER